MALVGSFEHTPVDAAVIPADEWLAQLNQFKTAINTIDKAQMNTNSVGTDQVEALAITTAKLAADCVTAAKIADDAIDSEHYVDSSIDTQHIADAQITAAKLGNMFEAAQDDEVATDTVTETDWHDIVGSSVSVTLDVASDVLALGFSSFTNESDGIAYLRVVYDTGGGVTQVGQDLTMLVGQYVRGNELPAVVGGVALNLAADTYTFKLQAKVSTGTGTYTKCNISVLSVPHR